MKTARELAESAGLDIKLHSFCNQFNEIEYDVQPEELILLDIPLEALVRVSAQGREVVAVWKQQLGRVFESMGGDNPRAQAIDEAITNLEQSLIQLEQGVSK